MKKKAVILGVALLVLICGVLAYRQYIIGQLENVVLAKLNDPDSAKIRNIKLFSGWLVNDSAMCGEINAKNRMGGYVGYRRFKVIGDSYVVIEEESDIKLRADLGLPDIYACTFGDSAPWWGLR